MLLLLKFELLIIRVASFQIFPIQARELEVHFLLHVATLAIIIIAGEGSYRSSSRTDYADSISDGANFHQLPLSFGGM